MEYRQFGQTDIQVSAIGFGCWQHDTTSAHDAIAVLAQADVPEEIIARMMGGNAAAQFGVALREPVHG